MPGVTATEQPSLIGRRIVGEVRSGDQLRELCLDDGTLLRFDWRVGTDPAAVGVRIDRRPGRRWRDRDDDSALT